MFYNFPAHDVNGIEWWYLTGPLWVVNKDGSCPYSTKPSYGLQATFFKSKSEPASSYSLLAHMAESDFGKNTHTLNERFDILASNNQTVLSMISFKELFIQLTNWRFFEVAQKQNTSVWILQSSINQIQYDLFLNATADSLWKHGENGTVLKVDKTQNKYVSVVDIDAQGTRVDLQSGHVQKICGRIWFDQETDVKKVDKVNWSWFSATLSDKTSYMFYKLKSANEVKSFGEVFRNGKSEVLNDVKIQESNTTCLQSKNCYAQTHDIYFLENKQKANLRFESLLPEQENISKINVVPTYWEGLTEVTKSSGSQKTKGYGYVEITR